MRINLNLTEIMHIRRGGLMVSAPAGLLIARQVRALYAWRHLRCAFGKTLASLSKCLSSPKGINGYRRI